MSCEKGHVEPPIELPVGLLLEVQIEPPGQFPVEPPSEIPDELPSELPDELRL